MNGAFGLPSTSPLARFSSTTTTMWSKAGTTPVVADCDAADPAWAEVLAPGDDPVVAAPPVADEPALEGVGAAEDAAGDDGADDPPPQAATKNTRVIAETKIRIRPW
jgi:hypothetical protein